MEVEVEVGTERRETDRAAGSGPFLGGFDCLAVVAIGKQEERTEYE